METQLGQLLRNFTWAGRPLGDYDDRWALFFGPQGSTYTLFSHSSPQALSRRVAEVGDTLAGQVRPKPFPSGLPTNMPTTAFAGGFAGIVLPIATRSAPVGILVFLQPSNILLPDDKSELHMLGSLLQYNRLPRKSRDEVSDELSRVLQTARQQLGLTQDDVARRLGIGRITFSRWESGAQPPGWKQIVAWCTTLRLLSSTYSLPAAALPIVRVVDNITPELLRFLKEDPSRFRQITPERFEQFAADRLDRMGFTVTLTGATNRKDGGVDIIGAKRDPALGNFLIAAQVKHHRGDQKTGRDAVDRILSLKNTLFRFGLVVTNTTFTRDAKWVAAQGDNAWFARLRDFEAMKLWLEENLTGERDYTKMPDEIELAPGIRIRVPRPDLSKRKI